MNCKLKLHSKGFGAEPVLKFLQTLVLDFPHICLQFFRKLQWAGRNIFADKCMENFRKLFLCMQLHVTPSNFFIRVLRSVKLKFTIHVFFEPTAVLRKLFDIRFSYKHCNFSRDCLLVKMTSKTITRSIVHQEQDIHTFYLVISCTNFSFKVNFSFLLFFFKIT